MENQIILDKKNVEFADAAGLAHAFAWVQNVKGKLKAIEESLQEEGVKYFKEHPELKEIELGNEVILYCAKDKKEAFKTQKIYELFKFTPEQQCILEKNPGFRKTELKKITGIADDDFEKEFLDVTFTDKVKVKTLDKKFLK